MNDARRPDDSRRRFLKKSLACSAALAGGALLPRVSAAVETLNARYPDPAVRVLDDAFLDLRLFNASVEKLADGLRWAEGPVWVGDGRYLLLSDIPNNRIVRWDEISQSLGVYRDVVVKRDGSIWFTDPPFQTGNFYEGHKITPELPHAVYRIDGESLQVTRVIDDLNGPNGLCFSPDEKTFYIVEGRAKPNRLVWAYTVNDDGSLGARRKHIEATEYGALDGIKCDEAGNLWCGWGSSGSPEANPEVLDGVRVFDTQGKAIGHIHLPERCANLCFGGDQGNRLFMASSHAIYSLFVNTRGATFVK